MPLIRVAVAADMHHPLSPAQTDAPPSLVRAELDQILGSEVFSRSDRLSAFLRFIVEQTLSGHGDSLKEHVIAIELYGKSADFNTAADPIVRVDARRLRDKLREYYASSPGGGMVISVPKGSYTPVFDVNAVAAAAPRDAAARGQTWRRLSIAGALVLVGALAWLVVGRLTRQEPAPAWRQLTVTSLPGSEENPALSPDGNFVAFSWTGPAPSLSADIWVKAVEGDALRQLTSTPDEREKYPAWSPDGRHIAFTRLVKGVPSVYMVSSLGGPERLIAERADDVAWLQDGQSLIMASRTPQGRIALVLHALATGERRQVTEAPAGFTDGHPRVSPDGKRLAFSRYGEGRSALFVVPVAGGEPTRIGEWSSNLIGGLTWTPDGREILFARPELSGRRLVRVVPGGGEPVAVPAAPYGSVNPSVSPARPDGTYRLALSGGQVDVGLRMIDLQAPRNGARILADEPFCDATRMDVPGRFSRDGTQVAFVSDRGGSQQIWMAGRDGSALRSVTNLSGATMNVGSWSPDGQLLIFDATIAGNTDLYVARVADGSVQRITQTRATEYDAEWSRDGRWVYFVSNESGEPAIWKMPAGGGPRVQLTSERGFEPRESPDGRSVYFVDRPRLYGLGLVATLRRVPIHGGASTIEEVRVMPGAWDVTDAGIVFVVGRASPLDTSRTPDVVALYDFADGRVSQLGELRFRVAPFGSPRYLAVTPDSRWALASHVDNWDRDIMVVDNFR